jgi:ribose-phosphate pyrophosphokinase
LTTFAASEPRLRRLFQRVDFAPQPQHEGLRSLTCYWLKMRGEAIAPRPADMRFVSEAASTLGFIFAYRDGERGYEMVDGGPSLRLFLGPDSGRGAAGTPKSVTYRRGAARLRRLFETVREGGEPVVAAFAYQEAGTPHFAELFAAPLSSDGHTVDGIFGGIATEPAPRVPVRLLARLEELSPPVVFGLHGSEVLAREIGQHLGVAVSPHEERDFEDGEHKIRPLRNVRGRDVFLVQSLHGDDRQSVNDKLCRVLFFIGALKDAAAGRITLIAPYLAYSRKDRQTKPRDPVTTRYVAQLLEAMGIDRVITLDVHNVAAFQNAFRCDTDHLEATNLFAQHFARELGEQPATVVSPDLGGVKRAEAFRGVLQKRLGRAVGMAFMDKQRSMGVVSGDLFAGEVAGAAAIIYDDLISSGTTMARVAAACRARGAQAVHLAATHGLFTAKAAGVLSGPTIDSVVVTDSVPQNRPSASKLGRKLLVLGTARLLAETVDRCHTGGSIVSLLAPQ